MSSDVIPLRPKPVVLSKEAAEAWLRAIVLDSKGVGFADHASEQMIARDISSRQVWEVLKSGAISKEPKWDDDHGDWVCVLSKTVAGRKVFVVVGLESKTKMTVVTTYG